MHVTALAGGVGGARFLRGLLDHLASRSPDRDASDVSLTIIGNTGDDITLFGLRVRPAPGRFVAGLSLLRQLVSSQ